MAEPRPDLEKNLDDIRKEVIEGRNLIIKTDNLLKTLHAELKGIGKWQEDYKKRQWVSSAVAYGIFAVMCIAGAIVVSNARTSTASADRERLEKSVSDLQAQIDKLKQDATAKQMASNQAADVYKLMTTLPGDERLKGIDALMKLDSSKISMLEKKALDDRAEILRKEVGQNAFERGKAEFRKNDLNGAVEDLSRFMAMNPPADDALEASFDLGCAYNMQKKHEQAVPYLARFVAENKHAKDRDYAMLLLAQSYEATNQLDKAAATARDALGTYPNSEYTQQLKNRLSSVKRAQSGGDVQQASAQPQQAPQVQQAVAQQQKPAQQQAPAAQQQPAQKQQPAQAH